MRATILSASAGSGKTYRLAYEYILGVLRNSEHDGRFDPTEYRRILAVTFTNKATEEMKTRILRQIHCLASGANSPYLKDLIRDTSLDEAELRRRARVVRTAILHDYSRFTILTNDTFFQRIIRAFIRELGIELNYTIELDAKSLLMRSTDALLEEIDKHPELERWIAEMSKDMIDRGERWRFREGITKLHNELFKEYTKDPILQASDKKQLYQTIFRYVREAEKTLEEMEAEIHNASRQALETISQAGYTHKSFSRDYTAIFDKWAILDISEKNIAPSDSVRKKTVCQAEDWLRKEDKSNAAICGVVAQLQQTQDHIIKCIDKVLSLRESSRQLLNNYRSLALLNDLYQKAMEICHDENMMVLSETKHIISQFIREEDAPFIYEKVGSRFDRYMIDEFQDTSLGEWHNFLPLLRNAMAQSERTSVLLVGDIKQSIYRWRGSDWRILAHTAGAELGESNVRYETLGCNFRSLRAVVEFNNMLFDKAVAIDNARLDEELKLARSRGTLSDKMFDQLQSTLVRAYETQAQKPMRRSVGEGYVEVVRCEENSEPDIIGCVHKVIDAGYSPSDIMVLVRVKKEAVKVADVLVRAGAIAEDDRYRFDVMTQEALRINNSSAVQLIVATMQLAIDRTDKLSLGLYNRFAKAGDMMAQLTEEESAFLDSLRSLSPEDAFEHIVMRYSLGTSAEQAYIEALHEHIVRFSASRFADMTMFVSWWQENSDGLSICTERGRSTIEIMTIHKAKGLENKVVIIPYCNWALNPRVSSTIWAPTAEGELGELNKFPVSYKNDLANSIFSDGYFEEKVYSHVDAINLLYVAFTRAAERLYIFIPNAKKSSQNVGQLTIEAIGADKFALDSQTNTECYTFGTMSMAEPSEETVSDKLVRLEPQEPSSISVRLRLPFDRYFDDATSRLSPRNVGIALHRVFENAATRSDILLSVQQLCIDGVLTESDAGELTANIEQALSNPTVSEWFDGQWQVVRCESGVILPRKGLRRPDRVMIGGNRAVVVDYKFGYKKAEHTKQVDAYTATLAEMGYSDIRGYVWYVRTGEIVECTRR